MRTLCLEGNSNPTEESFDEAKHRSFTYLYSKYSRQIMASDVIKDKERGGEDLLEYSALRNQGFSHLPQCALLIFHIGSCVCL